MYKFAVIVLLLIVLICWSGAAEYLVPNPRDQYIYDSGIPGPCVGILAGVHGNEPAGSLLLEELIKNGWFEQNVVSGSVRVIANPNPIGRALGIRIRPLHGDLNRSFPVNHDRKVEDIDAAWIAGFFEPCDVVIDFHEGWGFHQIQPDSLGSTLMANSPQSEILAHNMIHDLNKTIQDPRKKFVNISHQEACDIPTTFACFRRRIGRHHILVETSGQNNVQPLAIRQQQVLILIQSVLKHLKML